MVASRMVQVEVELEEHATLVQHSGSIVDTVLDPCRSWSHRDRSPFHTGCKRRWREGSGGRSIGLGLEL